MLTAPCLALPLPCLALNSPDRLLFLTYNFSPAARSRVSFCLRPRVRVPRDLSRRFFAARKQKASFFLAASMGMMGDLIGELAASGVAVQIWRPNPISNCACSSPNLSAPFPPLPTPGRCHGRLPSLRTRSRWLCRSQGDGLQDLGVPSKDAADGQSPQVSEEISRCGLGFGALRRLEWTAWRRTRRALHHGLYRRYIPADYGMPMPTVCPSSIHEALNGCGIVAARAGV